MFAWNHQSFSGRHGKVAEETKPILRGSVEHSGDEAHYFRILTWIN